MNTLFLNWQDPDTRRWFVVGRLDRHRPSSSDPHSYVFAYTGGVRLALDAGFSPILSFPDLKEQYESTHIFPLFDNRVLPKNRPEYADYIDWLRLSPEEANPFAILARSGGTSASDSFEVFPAPAQSQDGRYAFQFFVRGLRHQAEASPGRAEALEEGERLLLMPDIQNPFDPAAFALRTAETYKRDMHLLGYLPRYLAGEIAQWTWSDIADPVVSVTRVNAAPAPSHLRILASISLRWPGGVEPFQSEEYEPIA